MKTKKTIILSTALFTILFIGFVGVSIFTETFKTTSGSGYAVGVGIDISSMIYFSTALIIVLLLSLAIKKEKK